jgi:Lon protease-like protein
VAGEAVLPLFPLGSVLLPGAPLPLRIFEPRYRRLLDDIVSERIPSRFGVVALVTGAEVLTAPVTTAAFVDVGTVAEILDVSRAADGTGELVAVGSARFRIVRMLDLDTPYLQAEVAYLDEAEGDVPAELGGQVRAAAQRHADLLRRLAGGRRRPDDPYPDDPVLLSYRVATDLPLPREDAVAALVQPTAADRLALLQRLLRRELTLLRSTRTVALPSAAVQIPATVN